MTDKKCDSKHKCAGDDEQPCKRQKTEVKEIGYNKDRPFAKERQETNVEYNKNFLDKDFWYPQCCGTGPPSPESFSRNLDRKYYVHADLDIFLAECCIDDKLRTLLHDTTPISMYTLGDFDILPTGHKYEKYWATSSFVGVRFNLKNGTRLDVLYDVWQSVLGTKFCETEEKQQHYYHHIDTGFQIVKFRTHKEFIEYMQNFARLMDDKFLEKMQSRGKVQKFLFDVPAEKSKFTE